MQKYLLALHIKILLPRIYVMYYFYLCWTVYFPKLFLSYSVIACPTVKLLHDLQVFFPNPLMRSKDVDLNTKELLR